MIGYAHRNFAGDQRRHAMQMPDVRGLPRHLQHGRQRGGPQHPPVRRYGEHQPSVGRSDRPSRLPTSAFAKLDEEKLTQMSRCSAWLGEGLRAWPLSEAARDATSNYMLSVYRSVCRQTVKAGLPLGPDRQACFRQNLLAALPRSEPAPSGQDIAPRSALAVWRAWAAQGKLGTCLRWAPWLFWPALAAWPDRLKARLRRRGRRSAPA